MAKCKECKESFETISAYLDHIYTHKRMPCPNCGQKFTNKTVLTDHIRLHHISQFPYQCPRCLEKFKSSEHFEDHKSHPCEVESLCYKCDKKFNHRNVMSQHAFFDHRDPPYECYMCYGLFSSKKDHITHCENHVYRCYACESFFPSQSALYYHLDTFHVPDLSKEWEMDASDETEEDVTYTWEEYNELEFLCFVCLARFKDSVELETHYKHHGLELGSDGFTKIVSS